VGGWWRYSNGTDIPLTNGPPPSFGGNGTGMANAGFTLANSAQYTIPLGSYPQTQTPWGLLDVAGVGLSGRRVLFKIRGRSSVDVSLMVPTKVRLPPRSML